DVVEAFDRDIGREVLRGIDLHSQKVLHGIGILVAVQALDGNAARKVRRAALVERALEPANQRVDFLLRGLGNAGRRHLAPAQFAHNFLEDLGVFGHRLGAKLVQKEVTSGNELVVAPEAVGLNGGPRRFGMLRDLGRGLGEDFGVDRNDTDGTRNADKPSSVLHISHHLVRVSYRLTKLCLIVTQETGVEKGSANATWTARSGV